MFIGCLTKEAPTLAQNIGPLMCSLVLTVCSLKCLRLTFSHTSSQYMILAFSVLFFRSEYSSKTFVVDYFLISILYYKIYDLLLKVCSKKLKHRFNNFDFSRLICIMFVADSIRVNIHRSMANYLGFCVSCLRSTIFTATFCHDVCSSCTFCIFVLSVVSISW